MAEEIIVQNASQVKEIDYRRGIMDTIDAQIDGQLGDLDDIKTQLDDISNAIEAPNTDIISAQNEDIILMMQNQTRRMDELEAKLDAILKKL